MDSLRSNEMLKLNIDDINSTKVDTLLDLVSQLLNINKQCFDMMCFGRILLSIDKTLDFYGITNGTTIFVMKKLSMITSGDNSNQLTTNSDISGNQSKPKYSQFDIQNMVIALRTALMNPLFRNMLDKLSETEARENLMAVTPGLREDVTTFAILQDADLLTTLTEPTNIHKVLSKHWCLLEAATHLAATFHEETIAAEANSGTSAASLLARGRSQFNYSLDAMSDDEDMSELESPMDNQDTDTTNEAAQRIASMFVRAFQNSHSNTSNASTSQSPIITHDMLRQAIQSSNQQTLASTSTSTISTVSSDRWSTQLQQLRDMGIDDHTKAIRALEITNGDVQAAINLIFSDFNS